MAIHMSMNVIYHINRTKGKNHRVTSVDSALFVVKALHKSGTKGSLPELIKDYT